MALKDSQKITQTLFGICGYCVCGPVGAVALQEALGSYTIKSSIEIIGQRISAFFSDESNGIVNPLQQVVRSAFISSLQDIKSQYPKDEDSSIQALLDEIISECSKSTFLHNYRQEHTTAYLNRLADADSYIDELISKFFLDFKITEPEYSSSFTTYFRQQLKVLPVHYYRRELAEDNNSKAWIAHNITFQQEVIASLIEAAVKLDDIKEILQKLAATGSYSSDETSLIELLEAGMVEKFGIEYLNNLQPIRTGKKNYKDYINSNNLGYVSRSEFISSKGLTVSNEFRVESSVIEQFVKGNDYRGILIHGEGGIGKTRLMRELGFLFKYEGYIVLNVKRHLKDISVVNEFVNDYLVKAAGKKLVLLFDYIEEHNLFNTIIEEIFLSNRPIADDIIFIANCRRTFDWKYTTQLEPLALELDISIENNLEAEYRKYVIGKIVEPVANLIKGRDSFFEKRPAFAVFVRYLYENYPDKNDVIDSGIGFGAWLFQKLALTLYGSRDQAKSLYNDHTLFHLFALMPVYGIMTDGLKEYNAYCGDTLNKLLADGWLEEMGDGENKTLHVVQDTIADQLLVIYLQHFSKVIRLKLFEIFKFSIEFGTIKSSIISIDRISDKSILLKHKAEYLEAIKNLCTTLSNENILPPAELHFMGARLTETKILDEEEKLLLLSSYSTLFESFIRSQKFGFNLSYALNFYSKILPDKRIPDITNIINILYLEWYKFNTDFIQYQNLGARLISTYLKYNNTSIFPFGKLEEYIDLWASKGIESISGSYLIRSYLKNDGSVERISNYFYSWMKSNRNVELYSYVIPAWLNAGGSKEIVENSVVNWLAENGEYTRSIYMYVSWLDAEGDKDLIAASLKGWIAVNGSAESAGSIYGSWLKAGGDRDLIAASLKGWIAVNGSAESAGFIYGSWLKAGGEKEMIAQGFADWLAVNSVTESTGYVCASWLIAGGSLDLIKNEIVSWLGEYRAIENAKIVYQAWLEKGGDISIVKDSIREWLNIYNSNEIALTIYQAWLNANGDNEYVREDIDAWLKLHMTNENACYIYKPWLDSKGEITLVKEGMVAWLVEHSKIENACYVYQPWLAAGGNIEVVQDGIVAWLQEYKAIEKAQFVYKSWLDSGGDKAVVIDGLRSWLIVHNTVESAQYVYSSWLDAGGDKNIIVSELKSWLATYGTIETARFIYQRWLDTGGEKAVVKDAIIAWVKEHKENENACYIFQPWLDASGDTNLFKCEIIKWFSRYKTAESARFVYASWLKAKGDKEVIIEYILIWLSIYKESEGTQFVFTSWVANDGDIELIKPTIDFWLAKYGLIEPARFLYSQWYKKRYNKVHNIDHYVGLWLSKNCTYHEGVQLLINNALQAEADLPQMRQYIGEWLSVYGDKKSAYYIYITWLNKNGCKEILEPYLSTWLSNHATEHQIGVINKMLTDKGQA